MIQAYHVSLRCKVCAMGCHIKCTLQRGKNRPEESLHEWFEMADSVTFPEITWTSLASEQQSKQFPTINQVA